VTVSGAALVAVGALLPWVAVGSRRLNGFDLVTIARHFGLARTAGTTTAGRVWLCVPLLAGIAVAASMLGRLRTAGVVGAVVGVLGLAASGFTARAAGARCHGGVWVTLAAAIVALAGAPFAIRRPPPG
jgi:hypothetical protein